MEFFKMFKKHEGKPAVRVDMQAFRAEISELQHSSEHKIAKAQLADIRTEELTQEDALMWKKIMDKTATYGEFNEYRAHVDASGNNSRMQFCRVMADIGWELFMDSE